MEIKGFTDQGKEYQIVSEINKVYLLPYEITYQSYLPGIKLQPFKLPRDKPYFLNSNEKMFESNK